MSESYPILPSGMNIDDLRFVDPRTFPFEAAMKGWSVWLEDNLEVGRADVRYKLSRPVADDFGIDELDALEQSIGVLDDNGQLLPGYEVLVDTYKEETGPEDGLAILLDDSGDPHDHVLIFRFIGYPTEQTLNIMYDVVDYFEPKKQKGFIKRMLAKFAIGKSRD